jgi:hypothetical protein
MEKGYLIDFILLKKFQKMSDWIQGHVGHDNFAIAKLLRFIMVVALLLREVISFSKGIEATEIIVAASSTIIILKMRFIARNAEQVLKEKNGLMNPVANQYAAARIVVQFVSLAAFGFLVVHLFYTLSQTFVSPERWYVEGKELLWYFFGVLIFPVVYFSSCTPRPYNTSKARKFIQNNKLRQSVAPVMAK